MMISNTKKARSTIAFFVFTLVGAALLVKLGVWQISRAQEKEALLALLAQRQMQTLLTVAQLPADPKGMSVSLLGQFDVSNSILLDNQTYQGRVGYRWMIPFLANEALEPLIDKQPSRQKWILVEIGWIPAPARREELPTLPGVTGKYQLHGVLDLPSARILLADEEPKTSWPWRVQSIDLQKISKETGKRFSAWIVRSTSITEQANQPINWSALPVWTPVVMQPEKHYAYAVQWFGLALVLLIGYGIWWKQFCWN